MPPHLTLSVFGPNPSDGAVMRTVPYVLKTTLAVPSPPRESRPGKILQLCNLYLQERSDGAPGGALPSELYKVVFPLPLSPFLAQGELILPFPLKVRLEGASL